MNKKDYKSLDNQALNDHEPASDEEEDEEEEEMDENVGKIINVAFDARPPTDSDYHGVRRLLQQLFVKQINDELSELANLIVAQDSVGCVLKQDRNEDSDEDDSDDSDDDDEDDENVFAVNTVINLSQNQNLSCIERINTLLKTTCLENHKGDATRMTKLLDNASHQIGLMISERFINIPPQVALPSYQSLKSDIERAIRKKKKFNFSHLILISKTYRAKGETQMGNELFYSNPEEQLFSDMCEFSYTYSVGDQRDGLSDGQWDDEGGDFESLRTVMVFDASALGHMISKLQSEISPT
ncbi:tetratricopeptide repeat protein 37 [Plakobranchus ocellatus]|uniref:Protein BCCIP homolog n=1 Tax=Plakobranchus ocellatus TaxID=259542 RepID=A0AAV3YJR8_9GAST|nr:tetratricopeptide repeat protein 37 [Plakobranchus ocellatus]